MTVKVATYDRAVYTYNALNWRVLKQADTDPTVNTSLEWRVDYNSSLPRISSRLSDDHMGAAVSTKWSSAHSPLYPREALDQPLPAVPVVVAAREEFCLETQETRMPLRRQVRVESHASGSCTLLSDRRQK